MTCKKITFDSIADAKNSAKRSKVKLYPYICPSCGLVHLTSKSKKHYKKIKKKLRAKRHSELSNRKRKALIMQQKWDARNPEGRSDND